MNTKVRTRSFEITEEMRASFESVPRDTCLGAHCFCCVCDTFEEIRSAYTKDFGISHDRLWVKFREHPVERQAT